MPTDSNGISLNAILPSISGVLSILILGNSTSEASIIFQVSPLTFDALAVVRISTLLLSKNPSILGSYTNTVLPNNKASSLELITGLNNSVPALAFLL